MSFQLLWSESALERITEILDFLEEENPHNAWRALDDLFERVRILQEHPRIGRPLKEGIDPSLRRFVVGDYVLIYRVDAPRETVRIVAIRHSRQKEFPEERW